MKRLALAALLGALALTSPASANEQRLGFDGTDLFGLSVAAQGDKLVVGAPRDAKGKGAVYVFERAGDEWLQTGKLSASDGETGDVLGVAVAIDGDEIVTGAPGDATGKNADQGSAYTFARTGPPTRTETAKLTADDGAIGSKLGTSVAIDGDTIVTGAAGDDIDMDVDQGSVYTFTSAGEQTAKLTASDGNQNDELGMSVAIEGDTIVAGAPTHTVGTGARQGAAYTFARTGAEERNETAELSGTLIGDDAGLGKSVAIDGDTIVAGAPSAAVATGTKGAVLTFARTGDAARHQTAKLTATDGAQDDNLGNSVAIDGDTISAGA